jgi:hypothetical protein
MPEAEITLNFTPEAVPGWTVKAHITVMGKPVGKGEAELRLYETTIWQPFKHNYGPALTDESGTAIISGVAGAYYLFGAKIDNIYYDAVAKLLVDKDGIKAGTEAKKSLVFEDGKWHDPSGNVRDLAFDFSTQAVAEVLICDQCGSILNVYGDFAFCPVCGAVYERRS